MRLRWIRRTTEMGKYILQYNDLVQSGGGGGAGYGWGASPGVSPPVSNEDLGWQDVPCVEDDKTSTGSSSSLYGRERPRCGCGWLGLDFCPRCGDRVKK